MFQWLGLSAGDPGSIPGWETKIPQAMHYGRKKKELKVELPGGPGIPLLGLYPEKRKTLIQKLYTPKYLYTAVLFTIAKRCGSNLSIHQQVNGQRRCDIYIDIHTHTHTHTHIAVVAQLPSHV